MPTRTTTGPGRIRARSLFAVPDIRDEVITSRSGRCGRVVLDVVGLL